jgi:hypothetical protein
MLAEASHELKLATRPLLDRSGSIRRAAAAAFEQRDKLTSLATPRLLLCEAFGPPRCPAGGAVAWAELQHFRGDSAREVFAYALPMQADPATPLTLASACV